MPGPLLGGEDKEGTPRHRGSQPGFHPEDAPVQGGRWAGRWPWEVTLSWFEDRHRYQYVKQASSLKSPGSDF